MHVTDVILCSRIVEKIKSVTKKNQQKIRNIEAEHATLTSFHQCDLFLISDGWEIVHLSRRKSIS